MVWVGLFNLDAEISCVTEKKMEGMSSTRDVGTQSTPYNLSSASSPSPASTPSIAEGSLKRCEAAEGEDSPNSNAKLKPEQEVCIIYSWELII